MWYLLGSRKPHYYGGVKQRDQRCFFRRRFAVSEETQTQRIRVSLIWFWTNLLGVRAACMVQQQSARWFLLSVVTCTNRDAHAVRCVYLQAGSCGHRSSFSWTVCNCLRATRECGVAVSVRRITDPGQSSKMPHTQNILAFCSDVANL